MDPQTPKTPPTPQSTPPQLPPDRPVNVPPRVSPAADRLAPQRPAPTTPTTPTTQVVPAAPTYSQTPTVSALPPEPTLQQSPAPTPIQPSNQPVQAQPTPLPEAKITTPTTLATPLEAPKDIMQQAEHNDRQRSITKKLRGFASFAIFVSTVIVAAMLINNFIFQSYYVDGTSMTPTLQNEDRLIIEKASKTMAGLQGKTYLPGRGEVVVLDSAILDQYGHQEQLIKRVVGVPGDTVIIKDGTVTIKNKDSPNGFNLDQNLGLTLEATYSETPVEVTVPDNSIYVLGDNRGINGSLDSRSFGLVTGDKVQGRLAIRIFPFNRTQFFN